MPKLTPIEQFVIDVSIQKRKEAGYSQFELAEKMNLSAGFIGKVESTKFPSKYNLNHVNKLAKIFKCSPKDFLPGEQV